MKKIILFLYSGIVFAQTPQVIKLKEYYKGEGVILDKSIHYPFSKIDYKEGYTPTLSDIKKTEEYFFTNYYEYETITLDCLGQHKTKERLSKKLKNALFVKKKFYKYNRQYAGYISKTNDTIIFVGLLNFKNKKKANEYYEGWKDDYMIITGQSHFTNQLFFDYNLSKKKYILNVSN